MSKLSVDEKTVAKLFQDSKADFLIPDYQRPYAWTETECSTLWDDVFAFSFPDDDNSKFDLDDEYYLGPIVTFKNKEGKLEIIDGQQRLTTLMLLLRAFYSSFAHMQSQAAKSTRENIERCIWKTDEYGTLLKDKLKIDSEVATDNDKQEFLQILLTGEVTDKMKSNYAVNYRFFEEKVKSFKDSYAMYFADLPTRIMRNCILLPIEADSQDTALRIFSTLNDRGRPLSDADIFKAQLYNFYNLSGKKDEFINKWKNLEEVCGKIFHPNTGTPMDELFTRYMYYERAKQGNKSSTVEALRKFYEKDKYGLFKNFDTLENVIDLANFWQDVYAQSDERFSDRILRCLYVLNYAPNGMWTYFVSVYYMHNRKNGKLDESEFYEFLNKITAFIWAYALTNPGVNALRTPVFAEMNKLVKNQNVDFANNRFERAVVENAFNSYFFFNGRPITKSVLVWWAFNRDDQKLLPLDTVIEIEHIYARNRQNNDGTLANDKNLEALGNKAILEKRINIRAADYRFGDKKKYYTGYAVKDRKKDGTMNAELVELAQTHNDFTEKDIEARNKKILSEFMNYLLKNGLLKD